MRSGIALSACKVLPTSAADTMLNTEAIQALLVYFNCFSVKGISLDKQRFVNSENKNER